MERPPYPQSPLHLEGYLFLVHAVRHPESARAEMASALDCDEELARSLIPDHQDPEGLQQALSQSLINCLLEAARDLSIPAGQELDESDVELLVAFSNGSWLEAKAEARDLDCYDVSNPLADSRVVAELWRHNQDGRHPLPDVDALLRDQS